MRRSSFSLKRALLPGLGTLGVFLVAAVGLVGWLDLPDPSPLWAPLAVLGGLSALIAFSASWASQTGSREVARAIVGLFVGCVALLLVGAWALKGSPSESLALTDAERQPMVRIAREGASRLAQPALRFSIADPGSDFEPAVLEGLEGLGETFFHDDFLSDGDHVTDQYTQVFKDPSSGRMIIVVYLRGLGIPDLEGFDEGFEEAMTETGGMIIEGSAVYDRVAGDFRLEGAFPLINRRFGVRARRGRVGGEGGAFLLILIALDDDGVWARGVVESLRLE